jgi:hypothetical protein
LHQVLERWVESALQNDHISGIGQVGSRTANCFVYTQPGNAAKLREDFVKERINKVDSLYGRTLGCRVSPVLSLYIQQDNHVRKRQIVEKRKRDKEESRKLRSEEEQACRGTGASAQG